MSTISNSFTQNENINTTFSNKHFEESKEDINTFSSTIINHGTNCFMQNNFDMSNSKVSPTLTNQMEEFEKIQSEIKYIIYYNNYSDTKSQNEILALSKMSKFRKMEDLRRLIERVAEEDSHRCRYLDHTNTRYFISDKSSNLLSSQRYKVCYNNYNNLNNNFNSYLHNNTYFYIKKETYSQFNQKKIVIKSDFDNRNSVIGSSSTTTTSRCSEETGTGGAGKEGDRAPGKQGIHSGPKQSRSGNSKSSSSSSLEGLCEVDVDEHFNNLYCYWQDNICLPQGLLCSK